MTFTVLLEIIGMLGFVIGAMFAYRNHELVKFATKAWFYFATACVVAALWSLVVILKEIGVIFNSDIEPTIFFAVTIIFFLFSIMSYFNFVKPFGKN